MEPTVGSSAPEIRTVAVIVGAGPAGLATAACLQRAGVEHVLLEQAAEVGASWRSRYDRLHLHTPKNISALPFVRFDRAVPRYPSRDDVVGYLERYVSTLGLRPRLGEAVRSIGRPDQEWTVQTDRARYRCRAVVVATGLARVPHLPTWPGRDGYGGEVLHSADYRNGAAWKGRRVLVIGIGNSGGEIAVDLLEHGATPTLSVRGPINVIPRDVLGIPVLAVGAWLRVLPSRVGDLLGEPLVRLALGDISKVGLTRLPYGPLTQLDRHGRVPLIDSGTIAQIRAGKIPLRGAVETFTAAGVRFAGGQEESFDTVIGATGFDHALGEMLMDAAPAWGATGLRASAALTPQAGLYLCGFRLSTRGMLNQIRHDAQEVARSIAAGG
jgi:indole-3-pyruvate monooxygenase